MKKKTFHTRSGVNAFETGGPEGLIRVEEGSPLETDDPAVISILETNGAHAVTSDANAGVPQKKSTDGDSR